MGVDVALVLVGALVALFLAAGLAIVVIDARRGVRGAYDSRPALGMAGGMLFGAALGTIVWLSTGDFVFWVVFMGGGMVTGLAIGSARAPEQR